MKTALLLSFSFYFLIVMGVIGCDDSSTQKTDASTDVLNDGELNSDAAPGDASVPSWAECDPLEDSCVLEPKGCCEPCGMPEADDLDAVNVDFVSAHYAVVCKQTSPICLDCATMPNPNLSAECIERRCVVVDSSSP